MRDLAVLRMPIAQNKESLPFQMHDLLPVPVNDAVLDFYPVRIGPAGGDDATRVLMSRLSIPRDRVEALKRDLGLTTAGTTDEERVAAEVTHEAMSELLTAVRNTLPYFAGVRTGVVFDHLSVAGGATRMRGFASVLAESTRISVVPVNPTAGVTLSRTLRGKASDEQMQAWITAIGLAVGSAA